ncbi:MAG: glycyl-radical enzyme activating protein [Ruminococcaceae bacterium]|nr:glycyl-radical enzyme activating protein [Oscillospiraceae bacterium]
MDQALVFSIEEFSVFDGPGIRTTVFLMGCPLRCMWCHSPEGQVFENFILRSPNGCSNCGNCLKHAVTSNEFTVFTQESIDNCPNNLLRHCAVQYTPDELYKRLEKNFKILSASGGGITFSGGEPTANPKFLINTLMLLEGKIHRAIQTSGACPPEVFSEIIKHCDLVMFDIKLIDEGLHIKYTGASNKNILTNLRTLINSDKDHIIRTPLIPEVTDTEENIEAIAKLLSSLGVGYIELLPYNKLAGAKYALVNRKYTPSFDTERSVKIRNDIFLKYGIETKIL